MAHLVLHLPEIESQGRKSYDLALTRAWLAEAFADTDLTIPDDAGENAGRLVVDAQKAGDDVVLQGTLDAVVMTPCARCNAPVKLEVSMPFVHHLTPRPDHHELPEELELTPEDLELEHYGGDEIALDALVREAILLELPMRPLHPEGECDPEVEAALKAASEKAASGPLAGLAALKDKLKS
ncbi:MAG: DUF177 domain-containing protein [Sandaracinus sp.]|nr:DUF177 domain-containing protein [Sandaracinus sp.]